MKYLRSISEHNLVQISIWFVQLMKLFEIFFWIQILKFIVILLVDMFIEKQKETIAIVCSDKTYSMSVFICRWFTFFLSWHTIYTFHESNDSCVLDDLYNLYLYASHNSVMKLKQKLFFLLKHHKRTLMDSSIK